MTDFIFIFKETKIYSGKGTKFRRNPYLDKMIRHIKAKTFIIRM